MRQEKYKMNLEYFDTSANKEVFKEWWKFVKRTKEPA